MILVSNEISERGLFTIAHLLEREKPLTTQPSGKLSTMGELTKGKLLSFKLEEWFGLYHMRDLPYQQI